MRKCPICGRQFDETSPGLPLPFCSLRCKKIDLKRWLNEEYTFMQDKDEDDESLIEGGQSDEND